MKNRILVISYLLITVVFVFGICLSFYDYCYHGYYTDKVINWIWLAFTVVMIFKFWKRKTTRIYFFVLLATVVLSIIPMAIPFVGIVYKFSTIDDYQRLSLNDTYRIERTRHSALSLPRLYIYERVGIFDKQIARPVYREIVVNTLNLDGFNDEIKRDKPRIESAKLLDITKDSLGIEYKISNKKKLIYHNLNNGDGY